MVRWNFADRLSPLHRQSLVTGHRLAGQVAEREINSLGFRVYSVAIHDAPKIHVIDLDVRTHAGHTPTIHSTCMPRVPRFPPLALAAGGHTRSASAHHGSL